MKLETLAKNNWQLEVRISGSTPESAIELLEEWLEKLKNNPDEGVVTNSGILNHARGYAVMMHEPGFDFGKGGTVFYQYLRKALAGYEPEEHEGNDG